MSTQIRFGIFIFVLVFIVCWIIYKYFIGTDKDRKAIAAIKAQYEKALQDKDKRAALTLGRQYYSKLRRGRLTIYDEQALTNDIASIS